MATVMCTSFDDSVTGGRRFTPESTPAGLWWAGSLAITTSDYTCSYGPNANTEDGHEQSAPRQQTATGTRPYDYIETSLSSAVIMNPRPAILFVGE